MSQISFSDAEYAGKRKKTRREVFLAEMELVVPWKALLALIEPHYPVAGRGRRPYPLESMLRVHLMQNWFALSDPAMEEALYEIASLRGFARLSLNEPIPDETTILNFRHLLEANELAEDILKAVNAHLARKGLLLKRGSIVDATIIAAPSSTKNADGERDPEMHQAKKGNNWCVSRTQAADLWCCTEDGSRPPEAGLQGQASNHPVLLRSKGAVVSDWGQVIP
jgi:IS5 family transposase